MSITKSTTTWLHLEQGKIHCEYSGDPNGIRVMVSQRGLDREIWHKMCLTEFRELVSDLSAVLKQVEAEVS